MGLLVLANVILRRWYVVVFGMVLTLLTLVQIHNDQGVYWARVRCVVLVPHSNPNPNPLTERSPTAIAALAVMDVNHAPLELRASSPDVQLYGLGVDSGTWVMLENSGNQWAPSAANPYIAVQATGATSEEVVGRIQTAVRSLREALARRQTDANASSAEHATLDVTPGIPSVVQVMPSSTRALGATALSGAALTLAAVLVVDRAQGRRAPGRRRQRRVHATGAAGEAS